MIYTVFPFYFFIFMDLHLCTLCILCALCGKKCIFASSIFNSKKVNTQEKNKKHLLNYNETKLEKQLEDRKADEVVNIILNLK